MRKFWRRKPPRPYIVINVQGDRVGPDLAEKIKAAVADYRDRA